MDEMNKTQKSPIPKLSLIIGGAVAGVAAIAVAAVLILGGGNGNQSVGNNPEDNKHTHSFGEWSTVQGATCAIKGTEERVCECGERETREIDKIAHTEVVDSAVASTCTSTGLTEGKHCSVCNTVTVAQQTVEKADHTYDNQYDEDCNICGHKRDAECGHFETEVIAGKVATCTSTGLTDGTKCKKCGEVIVVQETIPVIAHTYDNKYDEDCNICGHKRDAECGHFETETLKGYAATCTSTGLTDGAKCKKCGEITVAQTTIPLTAHTEVIDQAVASTCTARGLTEGKHCSVCSTILVAQTTIPLSAHTEVIDQAVDSTCTATGLTEGKHCSVCSTILVAQTVTDKKAHTEVIDQAVASTCTATGLTEGKHCSVCSAILVAQTVTNMKSHTETSIPAVAATCTATGLTEGKKCLVCGTIIVAQQETEKLDHTYDDKYDETCNKCGFVRDAECGHFETETLDGYAATCTSTGLTDGAKCKKCGEITVAQTTIPLSAHTEIIDQAVDSTCTATGLTEGKHCSVCSTILVAQTVTNMKSHTETSMLAVAATCTATGLTEGKKCSVCGTILVAQTIINAMGHSYDNGVVVTQASCVQNGVKKFTCTVMGCNYSYAESFSQRSYTATEIYEQSIEYVGEISVYDENAKQLGIGTCFVYSSDGQIITNYHVIENAYAALITVNNKVYSVKQILAYDENIDLAILKVDATGLTTANLCTQPVKTGETVYAIGSSRGLTNTYSRGMITYADRVIDDVSYVQHDASITYGNSGGPLINIYGEVIGINTWGISDSQNLNFAVFADEIDNLVYGQAMSLSDFYIIKHDPHVRLRSWLEDNYNCVENSIISFKTEYVDVVYSIRYDYESDFLSIESKWSFESGENLWFVVNLLKDREALSYIASYDINSQEANVALGEINAATFTKTTPLTYNLFIGGDYDETLLLSLYQYGIVDLISWFDLVTNNYNIGTTIRDFGFEVFERTDNSKTAREKLCQGIIENGVYSSNNYWYQIKETYNFSEYSTQFCLTYHLNTEYISAFYSISLEDGYRWNSFLSLDPESRGMYYICSLERQADDGVFEQINSISGYIDPLTFSENTVLTYTDFEGGDPAVLVESYSELILKLLDWVEYSFDSYSINISLSELGF